MMTHIYRQFEHPRGALGALACFVMSHRPSNKARNRWTVDLIAPEPNARVLEIGCGPGLALAAMCDRISTGRVVGLDHSPLMLVQAAKRNTRAIEEGRLHLHLGGLEALAELNGNFDVVYSINVAMFWRDRPEAFRAIRDEIRPGGLLATTYQPRHSGAQTKDAFKFAEHLCGVMTGLGFIDIRIEQLPLHPIPAVCVLGRRGE
jgi:SAM-dependent methyltransferase